MSVTRINLDQQTAGDYVVTPFVEGELTRPANNLRTWRARYECTCGMTGTHRVVRSGNAGSGFSQADARQLARVHAAEHDPFVGLEA